MKSLSIALVLTAASLAPAFADGIDYRYPDSRLQSFACQPVSQKAGTICYKGDFSGQTLNDRPVKASVHAEVVVPNDDTNSGETRRVVRLSITKLEDPTNFYNPDGSMAVLIRSKVCGYHRSCAWSTQSATLTVNRTPGQRYFENSPNFDVQLVGVGGAEYAEFLVQADIWLPMQQFPISLHFASNM